MLFTNENGTDIRVKDRYGGILPQVKEFKYLVRLVKLIIDIMNGYLLNFEPDLV